VISRVGNFPQNYFPTDLRGDIFPLIYTDEPQIFAEGAGLGSSGHLGRTILCGLAPDKPMPNVFRVNQRFIRVNLRENISAKISGSSV
jgi:hypothetical protein